MKLLEFEMVYSGLYIRIPQGQRIRVVEAENIALSKSTANLWRLDDLGDFMEDEIWKEGGK